MIKKGDKISVEYEGRFEDGEVFDSSSHGDHSHPLEFEVGTGQVIEGFDEAVIGMSEGEEKEFSIEPADGYGEHNPKLLQKIPRAYLPKEQEPKVGMMLRVTTADGQDIGVKIVGVEGETVTIDMNHPLAGKKIIFKIKIIKIEASEN